MSTLAQRQALESVFDGATYTITFNDPARNNKITVAMMRRFIELLREAHHLDALLLVIQAEGDDFCLGRDQGERDTRLTREQSLRLILEANTLLTSFPGVTISVVQGRAFGFGAGLAAQCDLTIAEDSARFAFDEINHGLAPLVVAEYLPRYVGTKMARELILTGRVLAANEACRAGIVSRVVQTQHLHNELEALRAELLHFESGALRLMKRYSLDLDGGSMDSPSDEAVLRLDDWLERGRPGLPQGSAVESDRTSMGR